MNRDEIIDMARQAGFFINDELTVTSPFIEDICISPMLKEFAKLVAKKEREACALLCYEQRKNWDALACADAIRAGTRPRGQE